MATVTRDECDVFVTINDVHTVRVSVQRKHADGSWSQLKSIQRHLSPLARVRLFKLIDRGLNPPPPRKKKTNVDDPQTE